MRLDLFVKLKYESSTIMLFVGIRYSILCLTRKHSDMRHIRYMMSALPLASARLKKLWILCLNELLDGDLCKKNLFPYFLFFLFLKHDFIRCVDFTHITASNTASDDVTN